MRYRTFASDFHPPKRCCFLRAIALNFMSPLKVRNHVRRTTKLSISLAEFHGLDSSELFDELFDRTGEDAIRHLFNVAASLDSMVVGEAQILSQVKQAYELACDQDVAGTLLHSAFQAANSVAKRVASETGD